MAILTDISVAVSKKHCIASYIVKDFGFGDKLSVIVFIYSIALA